MRPTVRLLAPLAGVSNASRGRTTGFIGLGRMGYEMAFNLFSKTLVESGERAAARFVVCDARQETAVQFAHAFNAHFPGATIEVLASPAQ